MEETNKKLQEEAEMLSYKILDLIANDCKDSKNIKSPGEHLYFYVHAIARINVKFILTLDGYAKVYGIEKLDKTVAKKWIDAITNELLELCEKEANKEKIH